MELSCPQAAVVLDVASNTIRNYIDRGLLDARFVGIKRIIRIDVHELRRFAEEYGFIVDEEKLEKILGG